MRKIYLTESQFETLMEQQIINENFQSLLKKVAIGALPVAVALGIISSIESSNPAAKEEMKMEIAKAAPMEEWKKIANDVVITVYNAVPSQCNNDVQHTASMFRLNLNDPASHKIVAMERTMMAKYGIKYGDIIKIEGTYQGKQDGIYQVQDTMNKKYAGQNKIDVLVPNNVKYGGTTKDALATVYVLNDKSNEATYRLDMAPEYDGNNANKQI